MLAAVTSIFPCEDKCFLFQKRHSLAEWVDDSPRNKQKVFMQQNIRIQESTKCELQRLALFLKREEEWEGSRGGKEKRRNRKLVENCTPCDKTPLCGPLKSLVLSKGLLSCTHWQGADFHAKVCVMTDKTTGEIEQGKKQVEQGTKVPSN